MQYIIWLEKELTKAKARLNVYRAQVRSEEKKRLSALRCIPVPDSLESDDDVGSARGSGEQEGKGDEAPSKKDQPRAVAAKRRVSAKDKAEKQPAPLEPAPAGQKRRRVSAFPKGVCLGCYQTVERGIPGYTHDYEKEACTWTPSREPFRTQALKRREAGQKARAEQAAKDKATAAEIEGQQLQGGKKEE